MKYALEVDTHHGVGPHGSMYGHPEVISIGTTREDPGDGDQTMVFACIECGYTAEDSRRLAHEDCDPEKNRINTTLVEKYDLDYE